MEAQSGSKLRAVQGVAGGCYGHHGRHGLGGSLEGGVWVAENETCEDAQEKVFLAYSTIQFSLVAHVRDGY